MVALFIISSIAGANNESNEEGSVSKTQNPTSDEGKQVETASAERNSEVEMEPEIEYTVCAVQTLIDDVQANALKATDTYKDQYIELTGILSNIDASGKYIDLKASDDDYSFVSVQCYIKDDTQKSKVMEMSSGDTVTLKGQVTDVGEVLGYSIDIIEIQ